MDKEYKLWKACKPTSKTDYPFEHFMPFDSEKCTLQKLLHKPLHLKGFHLTPPNYTYLL